MKQKENNILKILFLVLVVSTIMIGGHDLYQLLNIDLFYSTVHISNIVGILDVIMVFLLGITYFVVSKFVKEQYRWNLFFIVALFLICLLKVADNLYFVNSVFIMRNVVLMLLTYGAYIKLIEEKDSRKNLSNAKLSKIYRRISLVLGIGSMLLGAYFIGVVCVPDIQNALVQNHFFNVMINRNIAILLFFKLCFYFCYKNKLIVCFPITTIVAIFGTFLKNLMHIENIAFIVGLVGVGCIECIISLYFNLKRIKKLEQNEIECRKKDTSIVEKGKLHSIVFRTITAIAMLVLSAFTVYVVKLHISLYYFKKEHLAYLDFLLLMEIVLFILWFGCYNGWIWIRRKNISCDMNRSSIGKQSISVIISTLLVGFLVVGNMSGKIALGELTLYHIAFYAVIIVVWEVAFYLCVSRNIFLFFPISACGAFFTIPFVCESMGGWSELLYVPMGVFISIGFAIIEWRLSLKINEKLM